MGRLRAPATPKTVVPAKVRATGESTLTTRRSVRGTAASIAWVSDRSLSHAAAQFRHRRRLAPPAVGARFSFSAPTEAATVVRTTGGPRLQAKLEVGAPNDEYEREADRVADTVMRMPNPDAVEGSLHAVAPQIQRKCADGEDGERLQRDLRTHGGELTLGYEGLVRAAQAGGRPLTPSERAFFEPRFGVDFSGVRVHDDGRADAAARAVGARAYTLGQHVVFRHGAYTGPEGGRLLAHELAHVVQQTGRGPAGWRGTSGSSGGRVQRRADAKHCELDFRVGGKYQIHLKDRKKLLDSGRINHIKIIEHAGEDRGPGNTKGLMYHGTRVEMTGRNGDYIKVRGEGEKNYGEARTTIHGFVHCRYLGRIDRTEGTAEPKLAPGKQAGASPSMAKQYANLIGSGVVAGEGLNKQWELLVLGFGVSFFERAGQDLTSEEMASIPRKLFDPRNKLRTELGYGVGAFEGVGRAIVDNLKMIAEIALWMAKNTAVAKLWTHRGEIRDWLASPQKKLNQTLAELAQAERLAEDITRGLQAFASALKEDPALLFELGANLGSHAGALAARRFRDEFVSKSAYRMSKTIGVVVGYLALEIALLFLGPKVWIAKGSMLAARLGLWGTRAAGAVGKLLNKIPALRRFLLAIGRLSKGADGASDVAKAGKAMPEAKGPGSAGKAGACFVEGTQVVTAGGRRPIETIRVGERILAFAGSAGITDVPQLATMNYSNSSLTRTVARSHRNADSDLGEVVATVTNTFVRRVDKVIAVDIAYPGGTVDTLVGTPNHPFWVPAEGRYVALEELAVGAVLRTVGGGEAAVVAKSWKQGAVEVFDVEVEALHCFYVAGEGAQDGAGGVLVHNSTAPKLSRHDSLMQKKAANLTEAELDELSALRKAAGLDDLAAPAGTPQHKASRWERYKARKAEEGKPPLPYSQWSNTYQANMVKATRAHAVADAHRAKLGWGKREVTVSEGGISRQLDIADVKKRKAVEVKEGYVSNNADVASEIARDKVLAKRGWEITWHVEGRASETVRKELAKPPPIKLTETRPNTPIKEL